MHRSVAVAFASLLALMSGPAPAQPPPTPGSVDAAIVQSVDFLAAHPDLRFRVEGLAAYEAGDHARALQALLQAAHHADKASQALIADMHWNGQGTATDRAQAYAWMDLAAERGYPRFVAFREWYWSALTPAERERAIELGKPIYADYGDAIAKPRMEAVLRKRRMHITGSHAGYVNGALQVVVHDSMSDRGRSIPAFRFYQPRYWMPRNYYEWQDEIFQRPVRGNVDIGPIATLDAAAESDD